MPLQANQRRVFDSVFSYPTAKSIAIKSPSAASTATPFPLDSVTTTATTSGPVSVTASSAGAVDSPIHPTCPSPEAEIAYSTFDEAWHSATTYLSFPDKPLIIEDLQEDSQDHARGTGQNTGAGLGLGLVIGIGVYGSVAHEGDDGMNGNDNEDIGMEGELYDSENDWAMEDLYRRYHKRTPAQAVLDNLAFVSSHLYEREGRDLKTWFLQEIRRHFLMNFRSPLSQVRSLLLYLTPATGLGFISFWS